jgi:hypothetical protein
VVNHHEEEYLDIIIMAAEGLYALGGGQKSAVAHRDQSSVASEAPPHHTHTVAKLLCV